MDEKDILAEVWPKEEELKEAQEKFESIRDWIEEKYGVKADLMGSIGKRTFISGDKDLDIFIFFSRDISEEELEDKGLEIGESVFEKFGGDFKVEFAEHPYTKGDIDGFDVEIVPAYDIDGPEDMKSSVDRTPMHKRWINSNLELEEKKQVVLLKQFLKGTGLYGSTLKKEGFSGYLCELLIAHFGSFKQLLDSAIDWDRGQIIDPENYHEGELPEELEEQFTDQGLIVIDPTDPERNVASVLSMEKYSRFIYEAWKYLEDPSERFFFPEEIEVDRGDIKDEIDARGDMIVVEFERPDVVEDILYPQLRKLMERIIQLLRKNEFQLFDSGFWVGEGTVKLVFDFQNFRLPDRIKHSGPEVFHNQENIENFSGKYDNVWVEETRLTTLVEREYRDAEELLEEFFQGDPEKLREKGVPKHLAEPAEEREIHPPELEGENWLKFLAEFLHLAG
ncbi:MAG: CCA tRNA nucleotidyltransferase [Candidatus Nanohaloarchaea archaeon]|nr:CCA tRNA nucleotidyltransferase [Candidatus Nanohaloarchaea archaeon]